MLEPVGDRILVEPHEQGGERKTKGGVWIPDIKEAQNTSGVVKAVGPGKMMETGVRSTMEFEVGDTVLYGKFAGVKVPYEEEEYLFLRESDIIAKVRADDGPGMRRPARVVAAEAAEAVVAP